MALVDRDHIRVLDAALAQLPEADCDQMLVRADTGGGTKAFLHHISDRLLQYSVGFYASVFVLQSLDRRVKIRRTHCVATATHSPVIDQMGGRPRAPVGAISR